MAALLFPLRRVNEVKLQVTAAARARAVASALDARGLAALLPWAAFPSGTMAPADRTTIETPDGPVEGLAIPTGITLFVTSGVSGAGAWLRDRIARSEQGSGGAAILAGPVATLGASRRAFGPLDLRAFVRACPEVPDPGNYAAEDAPAPLALAASLVEAVEAGARVVVIDEDEIPAGAFGRDARMQHVLGDTPPLTPLAERLAELRDRWGLSFFIAARGMGGLGDVADAVFILRGDRLERAAVTRRGASSHDVAVHETARSMRIVTEGSPGALKVAAWGGRGVRVGEDLVDLKDTTLVGDAARLRAVAALLKRAASLATAWRPVEEVLDSLEEAAAREALDRLEEPGLVDLTRPSRIEIASALVRWRRVTFRCAAGKLRAT